MRFKKQITKKTVLIFIALIILISLTMIAFSEPVVDFKRITFNRELETANVFLNGSSSHHPVTANLNIYYGGNPKDIKLFGCTQSGTRFECVTTITEILTGDPQLKFKRGVTMNIYGNITNNIGNFTNVVDLGNITPNKIPELTTCENEISDPIECTNLDSTKNTHAIRIINETMGSSQRITCQYDYYDKDEDAENISLRLFTWYKENETTGEFEQIGIPGSTNYITSGFTINDTIICELKVHDNFEYSNDYNSSEFSFLDNKEVKIDTKKILFDREKKELTVVINGTSIYDKNYIDLYVIYRGELFDKTDRLCQSQSGNTFECTIVLTEDDGLEFKRGEVVSVSAEMYNETTDIIKTISTFSNITPNKAPALYDCNDPSDFPDTCEDIEGNFNEYGIRITNGTHNEKPKLTCEYTYIDDDGDSEFTSQRNVKWYIQNEGFGNFIELLGQNTTTLLWPKFDQNDNVKCSIRVSDGLNNSEYYNSSIFTYTENSVPNLYFINSSATFDNPVQVGEQVTLTAKVYDNDLTLYEMLNVTFCKNEINQVENKGGTDEIGIGLFNETSVIGETIYPVMWIFSDLKETPIEVIRIVTDRVFINDTSVDFSKPIFDIYAYEVNEFGQIPQNHVNFVTKDHDNIIVANTSNRFNLEYNTIISQDKYLAIKICVDSNDDGNCDANNGYGDYFTVLGNESLNETSGENKSYFGFASAQTSPQTMFHSDHISFTYGLSSSGDNNCWSNLMCSQESDPNDAGPTYNLQCTYTAQSLDDTNQTFSAFASDKLFYDGDYYYDPDSKTSRTLNSVFYINHPPVASEVELQLNNGSKIDTYTLDNQSLYCDFSISDSDSSTFTGTKYDTTSFTTAWYYRQTGQSEFRQLITTPTTTVIAHGNTNPGDQWYCNVTPKDGFTNGITQKSQVISIIGNDEVEYFTKPIITGVQDGSYNLNTGVYLGNNLSVNVQWKSVEDSEFKIYTCSGNNTDVNFIGTGCEGPQFDITTIDGTELPGNGLKNYTINFKIDSIAMGGPHYYTVFVCNSNFNCSNSAINATGDFFVRDVAQQYKIKVKDPDNLTINNPISVTGVLRTTSNGTNVDVWTYKKDQPYPFKLTSATSFNKINPIINTGTTYLSSQVGTRYIYIKNTPDNIIYFNGSLPYVGFAHNRSGFNYYEYEKIGQNVNYIIINLTEPLEYNVSKDEVVKTYEYKNFTGRFTIDVDLWEDNWNDLEFYSDDGGYLNYNKSVFYDSTGPGIEIKSNSNNESIIKVDGEINITLTDKFSLNLSSINVHINSARNDQQFILQNQNGWIIKEVPSIRDFLINGFSIIRSDEDNVTLKLNVSNNAPNENYTFFIEAHDTPGNYANLTKIYEYNKNIINLTNPKLTDKVTGNNSLRSNKLLIKWESSNYNLVENFSVELIEKNGTIEKTLFENKTILNNITYSYDNLSTDSCYYAKIGAVSRFGVITNEIETNCANYSESDNLIIEVNSEGKKENVIYINNNVKFEIETYNAEEINYRIEKLSNNQIVKQELQIATESKIADKYLVDFNKDGTWDVNLYKLYVNATGFNNQNESKEYLLSIDTTNPTILPLNNYGPYNNTDDINVNVMTRDNGEIKNVLLNSNVNGSFVNYSVTDKSLLQISGINYYNYSVTLDKNLVSSNSLFDIKFIVSDYAGNSVESDIRTITINNRDPYNVSLVPNIYWNKTTIYADVDISTYFSDLDGDELNYSLDSYGFDEIDINKFEGKIFGGFRNFVGNTTNLTLTVEDYKNGTYITNLSVILLMEDCESYKGSNNLFVGFTSNCNQDNSENPGDQTGDDTTDNSGGGSTGGGSSRVPGGGSGLGSSSPTTVSSGEFVKKIYNIPANNRTSAIFTGSFVTEIQFRYSDDLPYVVLAIDESTTTQGGIMIPKKPVLTYFSLNHTNIQNNKLNEVIMRIRIPINNRLDINKNNAILARWDGVSWDEFEAINYGSDNTYNYYAVRVPGMSYFAILKDEIVEIPNTEKPGTVTTPTSPTKPVTPLRPTPLEDESSPLPIILFSIGIIIMIVGIGGVYFMRKKQELVETLQVPEEQKSMVVIDPLEEYIKKHLDKGIASTEIKAALLKAGWTIKEIDYVFGKIETNKKEINLALVDELLLKQIKAMELKNYTIKEIKEELEGRHIKIDTISANLYYSEILSKLELEVRAWIKRGYDKKKIRDHLLDLNWPAMTVYELLKKYK